MLNDTQVLKSERDSYLESLGLTLTAAFIPFGISRSRNDEHKSLNWRLKLSRGRHSIQCDYSAGMAHVPGWRELPRTLYFERLRAEYNNAAETGEYPHDPISVYKHEFGTRLDIRPAYQTRQIPAPPLADVLSSLLLDANCGDDTFEGFCQEFGYDEDSRKARKTWKACVEIRAKMARMFTAEERSRLAEVFQDY